jgi:hypothetical protein
MTSRSTKTRTTFFSLAVAAVLVPTALARPIPIPEDGGVADEPARVMKPTLSETKPGMTITPALQLAALAGTATTSR